MNSELPNKKDYMFWAGALAGAVRAAFGLVWAFDAYLKWQPDFLNNYLSYVTGVVSGQPGWLMPWFHFWVAIITPAPALFAWLTRIIETVIALGLLFGFGRKWVYVLGGVFALLIWSVPEGFGGPYSPGATDVGAGIVYMLLFVALIVLDYSLGRSPYSVDYYIGRRSHGWKRFSEWANAASIQNEPKYIRWSIQIPIIIGLFIILIGFLLILSGELKSNASSSSGMLLPGIALIRSYLS